MLTAVPYDAPLSAVVRMYLQQRRLERLRSARRLARGLALALVLVLIFVTVTRGPTVSESMTGIVALLLSLAAWMAATAADFRVHSSRIDARVGQTRLGSVRRHLGAPETPSRGERTRRSGADVLTVNHQQKLHEQVRTLEHEIDESDQRAQRALLAGAVAAALGAVSLGIAVGASLLVSS